MGQRRRKKRRREVVDQLEEDVEGEIVAIPITDPATHARLRKYVYGRREWWVLLGFESEYPVREFLDAVEGSEAETELVTWPVVRLGEQSGKRGDALFIMFAKKTTLTPTALKALLRKHGAKSDFWEGEGRDILTLTWGYRISLLKSLDRLLQEGTYVNN